MMKIPECFNILVIAPSLHTFKIEKTIVYNGCNPIIIKDELSLKALIDSQTEVHGIVVYIEEEAFFPVVLLKKVLSTYENAKKLIFSNNKEILQFNYANTHIIFSS